MNLLLEHKFFRAGNSSILLLHKSRSLAMVSTSRLRLEPLITFSVLLGISGFLASECLGYCRGFQLLQCGSLVAVCKRRSLLWGYSCSGQCRQSHVQPSVQNSLCNWTSDISEIDRRVLQFASSKGLSVFGPSFQPHAKQEFPKWGNSLCGISPHIDNLQWQVLCLFAKVAYWEMWF